VKLLLWWEAPSYFFLNDFDGGEMPVSFLDQVNLDLDLFVV
jgi:hypothetical protein